MTGPYAFPVGDIYVPCSYDCHASRNPPSTEPGTDYACAYGTAVVAPANARVHDVKTSNSGAPGRVVYLACDDGSWLRMLHMSSIGVSPGQHVAQGEYIGAAGASGYNSDWYYGPHLHQTCWESGVSGVPSPGNTPPSDFERFTGEEEDMTPQQADQLLNIYNAIFNGGPSMPDNGFSLGQTVSDIAAGERPVVHRGEGETSWIQELADIKTLLLQLRDALGSVDDNGR